MRDFFSVLLQVSFATKSCGDDLQASLECWKPLLRAVSQRSGKSISSVISEALVRQLQNMDNLDFSDAELDAMELPSKNDEMGSSLIEKLDDHTLAHCFSFLSVKDVCTGIERSSHRFLQVSRNAKLPFFQECAVWNSERREPYRFEPHGWHTALDHLLYSRPKIPDSIAFRNLRRFKIGTLKYDPVYSIIDRRSHHQLKFQDVIRVIGKNVQSLDMRAEYEYDGERDHFFPEVLSHITNVKLIDEDTDQLERICSAFPKCRKLDVYCGGCQSLKPLNQLCELESLKFTDHSRDCSGGLDPTCFPNLKHLSIHPSLLVHFSPLFTPQIESLDLDFTIRSEIDPSCVGNLSGLRSLKLKQFDDRELCKIILNQLGLPDRIPRVSIKMINWNSFGCWVNRVDELECGIINNTHHDLPLGQVTAALADGWIARKVVIQMTDPSEYDFVVLQELLAHSNTQHSEITLNLTQQKWNHEEFDEGITELRSIVDERAHLTLDITRRALMY